MINRIEVDFTILYSGTEIYTRDQFERPISNADATAVGITFRENVFQSTSTDGFPMTHCRTLRHQPANTNVTIKWMVVVANGTSHL